MWFVTVLTVQMAPLKVDAANSAGDVNALEEAIDNFEELGLSETAPAIAAQKLLHRIKSFDRGWFVRSNVRAYYNYACLRKLAYVLSAKTTGSTRGIFILCK